MLSENFSSLSLSEQVTELFACAPLLAVKINQRCDLAGASAAEGLLEVLRFLALTDNPGDNSQVLTPSERVDRVWHEFILFTRLYASYCDSVYGRFIHHTPDDNISGNARQFEVCLERYHARFGEPDSRFWGRRFSVDISGNCSGCQS